MLYREANLFLERHAPDGHLTDQELDDLDPELHGQLQEILKDCEALEDILKHSLLKDPPPDLWYGEGQWSHVLAAVASACLVHDVKGVVRKILTGDLPRTPSGQLHD
jgi:hypothetical protein